MEEREFEMALKFILAKRFKERTHFHHDHEIKSWRHQRFWFAELVGTQDVIVARSRKVAVQMARKAIEDLWPLGKVGD